MRNNVQELEQSLEKAKKEQYLENRLKELEDIKREYEGKCFSSNLFNRIASSRSFSLKYYEKFYIKENEIFVLEWILYGTKHPALYKSNTPTYNLNTYMSERKLSGNNEYNACYNLDSGFSFYRKEITLSQFMSLWRATKECYLIIKDSFKNYPELEIEDVRQGEHRDEQSIESVISELELDIIDLKQHPKMYWIFEYNRSIPMLQNGRWLPRIYAKQILEYVISLLKKDIKSAWTTPRSIAWTQERINNIQEFINLNL